MPSPVALPIEEIRQQLCQALEQADVPIIVQAPTGSGKSTQVPQMLLDAGMPGQTLVLQPRRIAARMLARRVAFERGVRLGEEVGYQVRFERVAGPKTRLRYLTEGVLLRQMLDNPTLRGVGAVVFDEFHERHLDADVGLARCRLLQQTERPDLVIIVMSATLEVAGLQRYLAGTRVLRSEGRTFPVTIQYAPQGGRTTPIWEKVATAARTALTREQPEGHALVFLPGSFEIRKTIECLRREKWTRDLEVLPLYGDLAPQQQDEAVAPSEKRRIIVATNVAETSLTIEGVRCVIDSGLARLPNYDASRGINTLTIESISKASADQRAGRAGRTAPGLCVRLWSETEHRGRIDQELPEIHRLDLAEMVLNLKESGVDDLEAFPWFEAPDPATLARARDLLVTLGALEPESGALTALGRRMTAFPVPPRHARMLVEAEQRGQGWLDACLLVALAQGRSLFPKGQQGDAARRRFLEPGDTSDFSPLLRAFQTAAKAGFDLAVCREWGIHANAARECARLVQLLDRLSEAPLATAQPEGPSLADLILCGFPDHVAVRRTPSSKVFEVGGGRRGQLSADTVIENASQLIVAGEIAEIEGKEVNVILSLATAIEREDLRRHFPDAFHEETAAFYQETERRIIAERRVCFRDLVLERKQAGEPDPGAAAALLADRVFRGELKLKQWNHAVDSWLARVDCLRRAMPELELPVFTEEDHRMILTEICHGASTYKQIKDRPVLPVVKEWLSPPLRSAIDSLAPEQVTLSNGTRAKVDYVTDPQPSIGVVLQRLYDVTETPAIANGRLPLLVKILAPNQRPAQITRDLKGFWETSYPAIKAQLKGRYPKHEWR